ncbi:MAG: pyruvate dehydrogenase (acetyl-transferring) E1 component subunit alpha [Deltaproteobacteria bacterium]|nr:pyruvate dehydrogenase (acetyl-transferring) E1 component subunit alpha [Deltaproteobacteria bacterium]
MNDENTGAQQIKMRRILDKDGRSDKTLMPDLTENQIREIYRWMLLARMADQRAVILNRQGRLGTYAPLLGQEASQIGSAYALKPEDWVVPSYRETGVFLLKNVPLKNIYLYWMGNEMGSQFPEGIRITPVSIPVGTQTLHAVGIAWAAKLRGERIVSAAYFGDGATSTGDFHEAMNFAGVLQTPTIFFCQNNQYAISTVRKRQSAAATLAQKALAYGFRGIQVDGNDVFAVYSATKEARESAVAGEGPVMIEAVTYRMGPHTTVDDPGKYRDDQETENWRPLDPILRLKRYMENNGLWNQQIENRLAGELEEVVDKAVRDAESVRDPRPEEMFQFTYEQMPPNLREQLHELKQFLEQKEG